MSSASQKKSPRKRMVENLNALSHNQRPDSPVSTSCIQEFEFTDAGDVNVGQSYSRTLD